MMNNFKIDRLGCSDAAALAAFYNALSDASIRTFRPLGFDTDEATCSHIATKNADMDECYDLVAWHDDRIVGWSFIWSLHAERPTFGLGVADAYQRQGVGSTLMDEVMSEARRRQLLRVYLTVVKENDIAWQMYARKGFVQYDEKYNNDHELTYRHMVAELGPSPDGDAS